LREENETRGEEKGGKGGLDERDEEEGRVYERDKLPQITVTICHYSSFMRLGFNKLILFISPACYRLISVSTWLLSQ